MRPSRIRARWSATSRWSLRPPAHAGAHVVRTPHQMIDLVQALVRTHPLPGPRIAVIGDGGGHGAIACDVAAAAGLELPRLSDALSADLARQLPHTAATRNPVDLAGGGEQDFHSYARVSRTLLESGEVDGVLLTGYFGGYSQYSETFAELEVDVARTITVAVAETGRPMVAHSMYADSPTAAALREGGVPVYTAIEAAAGALAGLRAAPAGRGRAAASARRDRPDRARLLRQPGAARGRGRAVRAVRPGAHPRGGAGRGRRARLPGGREGRRCPPQVRRGRRCRGDRRPGGAGCGRPRPDRPAGADRALGRAHGPAARGSRADRGRPLRPALRAGGDGRAGRDPHRGVRRCGGRPGAGRCRGGRAAAALAAGRRAPDRHPRPPGARHRRRRSGRGDALAASQRHGRTWPRSRSTHCWSRPPGRSRSTRA